MFDIGFPEFFVLALLALIVFGPERLPVIALQAARALKSLRAKASAATAELTEGLDIPDVGALAQDIQGLRPSRLINSALNSPGKSDENSREFPIRDFPLSGTPAVQVQSDVNATTPATVRAEFDPDAT